MPLELAPFGKIARQIQDKGSMDIGVGQDTVLSLPVVARRGEMQYDALFLFHRPVESADAAGPRPFAWALFDARSGHVSLVSRCDLVDFMPEGRYPPGSQLKMPPLKVQAGKKRDAMQDKLLEAYEELRLFAFEENLTRTQANAVSVYKDLFGKLTYETHYPFYHALSPVFFHWLRMPLPKEMLDGAGEGEAALQNDGYQLLILDNLRQLVVQFQEKIASDTHKNALFDEMHRELQEYKNGMLDTITQNLERDIVQVIDGVARSVAAYRDREPDPEQYRRLLDLLAGVETDLTDLLYRHGVEPYVHDGAVDVARQSVISTVATDNPALDKTVAERISPGWEKAGRVVRPERVCVYVYNRGESET